MYKRFSTVHILGLSIHRRNDGGPEDIALDPPRRTRGYSETETVLSRTVSESDKLRQLLRGQVSVGKR